ncbi:5'/3'-nucleotidase SurE [Rhodopirellula europaea]|jgi:5'-nucleotidase|uniref:5'-nucleotidase n=1 Tax=Rhodopirellula europaea SH398 TaxID=1263868 RepID=M5SJ12_9BACT|nr:5'/3'-nucleotidase SurE [Rhodopirellula europaea]EMI27707.1 stationary phase survival protein SurE [Rhodopirellula europaea SH398]
MQRTAILLTNDDGIDAPGLLAMHQAISEWIRMSDNEDRYDLTVVAPDRGRSECGHSVTTTRDLAVTELQSRWFAVDGTPVDCVRSAMTVLCPNASLVFSGINAGANLGVDLLVSGTFAAAREAALHGVHSMAVSHYRRPDVPKTWDHTGRWLKPVLDSFFREVTLPGNSAGGLPTNDSEHQPGQLWNVNLPAIDPDTDLPPMFDCEVERKPMQRAGTLIDPADVPDASQSATGSEALPRQVERQPIQIQSDFHGRPRSSGTDVERCFSGNLTISRISPYPA